MTGIFLIDQDGVLADWDAQFQIDLADLKADLPEDYFTRTVFDLFIGLSDDLAAEVTHRMDRPGFYADLAPIPGCAEALNRMLELGIPTFICTSPWLANPTCAGEKLDWVERHIGAGWAQRTILTRDKTLIRGSVLVDDKDYIHGSVEPTWEHVFFTQRYNRHLPGRRLDSWENWGSVLLGGAHDNSVELVPA